MNAKDIINIITDNAYDAYKRRKEAEAEGDRKTSYIYLIRYTSLLEVICQIKNCNEDEAESFILSDR